MYPYISQAEFFKPNRRLVNLWRLGLAFVDLDTYQTKWGSRTPEEVSLSVRTFLHDEGIPAASLIVSSGRGLYLKWLFETPIPQSALPRWNAVQRELVERLQGFGADPMAKDASRVLRLVQTVHAKTGGVVRVLHVEEAEGEPKRYGFDRLAGAVLPVERPQSQKDVSRRPFKVVEVGLGRERSLAWARLTDLRLLQDIRGRVVPEGEREVSLFWRLNFLLQSGQATARNTYHEARALARELDPGFVSESKKEAEAGFIKSNVGVIRRAATESSVTKREKADGSKDLSHCTHSLDKVRRRSCFLLFNV